MISFLLPFGLSAAEYRRPQLRALSFLAAAALLVTACADATDPSSSGADSLTREGGLESQTVLKGVVAAGDSLKVDYAPGTYEATTKSLPFLGIRIVSRAASAGGVRPQGLPPQPAAEKVTLHVSGAFPGTPDVLVVDDAFNVVAQTKGALSDSALVEADLELPPDGALVLVRDPGWVRPMDFDITVAAVE